MKKYEEYVVYKSTEGNDCYLYTKRLPIGKTFLGYPYEVFGRKVIRFHPAASIGNTYIPAEYVKLNKTIHLGGE